MHLIINNSVVIYLRYKISSWSMILISNDFRHKIKMYNFDPYNVLLAIDSIRIVLHNFLMLIKMLTLV